MTGWIMKHKEVVFFVGVAAAGVAIYLVGVNRPLTAIVSTWGLIMALMAGVVGLASWLITGNALFGWLVNEQNSMSLSRLQMFLWTVVVLSAFVTAVLANLRFGHFQEATAIALPQELWLAMGISTTSLVGSNLILDNKKAKQPKEAPTKRLLGLKADEQLPEATGTLVNKDAPSLLDLVHGEEVGNQDRVDLTRLQNLFFTVVLVGAYAAGLGTMFLNLATVAPAGKTIADNFPITQFPALGSSAVALLGISHAGYLANKVIDKQPSERQEE